MRYASGNEGAKQSLSVEKSWTHFVWGKDEIALDISCTHVISITYNSAIPNTANKKEGEKEQASERARSLERRREKGKEIVEEGKKKREIPPGGLVCPERCEKPVLTRLFCLLKLLRPKSV